MATENVIGIISEDDRNNEDFPLIEVYYCESSNPQGDVAVAYAITNARENISEEKRLEYLGKYMGSAISLPESIKTFYFSMADKTETSVALENALIFKEKLQLKNLKHRSDDVFEVLWLEIEQINKGDPMYGKAGFREYRKSGIVIHYPDEIKASGF